VFWEDADAQAATNANGVTLDGGTSRHCIHKTLSGNRDDRNIRRSPLNC
jgi:hypothetical protein